MVGCMHGVETKSMIHLYGWSLRVMYHANGKSVHVMMQWSVAKKMAGLCSNVGGEMDVVPSDKFLMNPLLITPSVSRAS